MSNPIQLVERERVGSVLGCFHTVYNYYGFGFVEPVYCAGLEYELTDRGHHVAREVMIEVPYKGRHGIWQRVDMIVDNRIILEIKATERLAPYAARQLVNYLHASSIQVGLLLHFGPEPKFHRFVHTAKRRH